MCERADLDGLLARPRSSPFLLNEHNERTGHAETLDEAARTGRPYVVAVARDVLAIDLDDPHRLDALDRLAAELADKGWPVLRVASGRPDHRHLWAVIPDAAERADWRKRAHQLGLPAPRREMRPPGSPHRLGLVVEAVDDPDEFAAHVASVRVERSSVDEPPERLDWRSLLTSGRWPRGWEGDTSGSALTWHVCIGASRTGHQLDDVRRLLADPANAGGRTYRARLNRQAKSHGDFWLDHYVWPSAVKAAARPFLAPADADEAREALRAIVAAIDAQPWPGTGGATERAVLEALIARGEDRGSLTVTMSHREIAEAAPCARSTAGPATRRLIAAGWLQRARTGGGRTERDETGTYVEAARATTWRLKLPHAHGARTRDTGGTPPSPTGLSVATTRAAARPWSVLDACRWRGLGLNAPRVLDALVDGPRSSGELARALRLNEGNLRYRLVPKMAAYGLVERLDDGRYRLPCDLDARIAVAAERLGLTGKAQAVAHRHAVEREQYLDHRDRTRPRRLAARTAKVAADRAAKARTSSAPQLFPELDEPGEAPTSPPTALDTGPPLPPPAPPPEPTEAPLVSAGGDHAA